MGRAGRGLDVYIKIRQQPIDHSVSIYRSRKSTLELSANSSEPQLYQESIKMAEETVTTEMDIQDPIVFLTSLRKACPDVISLLNSKQARLLSKSPTEPYDPKDINEQYLVDMASFFGMNQRVEDAERALRTHLLVPNKVKEEVDVASFIIKIQVLGKVRDKHNSLRASIAPHYFGKNPQI